MESRLTRRSLLAGLGASAVLAACGGSSAKQGTTQRTTPGWSGLIVSSDVYRSDAPQRFGFVVTNKGRLSGGPRARIGFAKPGATRTEQVIEAAYHSDGLETGRGVYVVNATFPIAGTWSAGIALDNENQFALPIEVKAQPVAPIVGNSAPREASPVVAQSLGVDPICTRDPACSLHDHSTDTIIGGGRPAVVLFATPARCQTNYCGPVLDLLLELVPEYQDRINFAHVEIYRDATSEKLSPTVEAWGLVTEPWLYTIDANGQIVQRLDGAFDRLEIRDSLAQLTV